MAKVKVGKNAKITVRWSVNPLDYSHQAEEEIISLFAKKYDVPKTAVKVEPKFIGENGQETDSTFGYDTIDSIEDPKFQQGLFEKYFNDKKKEDSSLEEIDINKVFEIDDLINTYIDYEHYEKHKKYFLKWIKWDNFMSYGSDNFIDFGNLNGLVLLSSIPANQGGKTTFCLDLFRFLLFGKVTSRESDWTLAKAFNRHLPEATEVNVEGCVCIDGIDYVIKRTLSRPELKRRSDKSKVTQKVSYYKVVNGEYIDLEDYSEDNENMASLSVKDTNKAIKEAIGNEKDFDLMICVTDANLKDLISLKDTERGRLIARWIGLLPLEEKDKIARDYYNKSILPKLMSSKYNKETLKEENEYFEKEIEEKQKEAESKEKEKKKSDKKIKDSEEKRLNLIQSKQKIDEDLCKRDVITIEKENESLIERGKKLRGEYEENKKLLEEYGEIEFDEEDYNEKLDKQRRADLDLNSLRQLLKVAKDNLEALEKGEFCPTCGARLAGVDNSQKIAKKKEEISDITTRGKVLKETLDSYNKEIKELEKTRKDYNDCTKLELKVEKQEVDLENLRNKIKENKRFLAEIKKNEESIKENNRIDAEIRVLDVTIDTEKSLNRGFIQRISDLTAEIASNKKSIERNSKIISEIEKEEITIKNWKLYLEMVGKNGVSKMVLRNALPIINGELKHLLSGVCDFDVTVAIDDHNDVVFYLTHDGVTSNLASGSGFEQTVSSLALRSVLSKISSFSKPSFVIFDEILGGVADENYDALKKLYDKLREFVPCIIQITHLKSISDWHDKFLVVTKENNISKITIQ